MGAATKQDGAPPQPTNNLPLDDFALRLIRRKAKQISRRLGFCRCDLPDLQQELALIVLRRLADFDAGRSHYNAFVTTVVERYTATILEHRSAGKRDFQRNGGSLNVTVADGEGGTVELAATICSSQASRHTGQHRRCSEDAWNLAHDVAAVLEQMPPLMRRACELIMRQSKAAAARELGMSQGALYEMLERILARFEKAGLRDYLK
jgi:DNA-directed RNA polymerase specialized sigma24 family protein